MEQPAKQYLYCVIRAREPVAFSTAGMDGAAVSTVTNGTLAAVVSETARDSCDFIREHLLTHQRVIEHVMRAGYDVLPFRFNSIASATTDIREKVLTAREQELVDTLATVERKVELGIRASWGDTSRVFREIVEEYPEIQRAKAYAQKRPGQFRVAAVGELVKRALDQKRAREAERILTPLRALATDFKERELQGGDAMICSSAFLVHRDREREFDARVQELVRAGEPRGIRFKYFGSIPPFNFVELHLQV